MPDVLQYYLYRDSVFTWKIIDISHVTPMKKYDGMMAKSVVRWRQAACQARVGGVGG